MTLIFESNSEIGQREHKSSAGLEDTMQQLAKLKRDRLFQPDAVYQFSDKLGEVEQDPFIGFVGRSYFDAKVRVCFLGKANAETKNRDYDIKINKALIAFKNANQKQRSNKYSEYRGLYEKIIPTWKIYRYPEQFLELLCWNLTDITYANIVPFRYVGAPSRQIIYKTSFEHFTSPFLEAVEPDFIIPLGKDLQYTVRRYYSGKANILKGVPRSNGDNATSPEANDCLEAIAKKIKDHMNQHDHC